MQEPAQPAKRVARRRAPTKIALDHDWDFVRIPLHSGHMTRRRRFIIEVPEIERFNDGMRAADRMDSKCNGFPERAAFFAQLPALR